jgi:acyl carrier protein
MDRKDVVNEIKDIVTTFFQYDDEESVEAIDLGEDDVLLNNEYGLSSIDMVSIVVEIERRFGIEVEDEYMTMEFMETIGTMADFVIEKLREKDDE